MGETKLETKLLLPPMSGLNDYDNPSTLDPSFAQILENFMPPTKRLQVRPGSIEIQKLPGVPQNCFHMSVGEKRDYGSNWYDAKTTYPSVNQIFVKCIENKTGRVWMFRYDPDDGSYDIEAPYLTLSDRDSFALVNRTLIAVTSSQTVAQTGYTWHQQSGYQRLAWKGSDSTKYKEKELSNLVYITNYRKYVFAAIPESMEVMFLDSASLDLDGKDPDTVLGYFAPQLDGAFDISGYCQYGGKIINMFTYGMELKENVNEYLCILTSYGELVVFSGTDPTKEETWKPMTVVKVSIPLNEECIAKTENDVIFATRNGFFSLRKWVLNQPDNITEALEYRIKSLFTQYQFKNEIMQNMFLRYDFSNRILIFNVPLRMPMMVTSFLAGYTLAPGDRITLGIDPQAVEVNLRAHLKGIIYGKSVDETVRLSLVNTRTKAECGIILKFKTALSYNTVTTKYDADTTITLQFDDGAGSVLDVADPLTVHTTDCFDPDNLEMDLQQNSIRWSANFKDGKEESYSIPIKYDYEVTQIYSTQTFIQIPGGSTTFAEICASGNYIAAKAQLYENYEFLTPPANGTFALPVTLPGGAVSIEDMIRSYLFLPGMPDKNGWTCLGTKIMKDIFHNFNAPVWVPGDEPWLWYQDVINLERTVNKVKETCNLRMWMQIWCSNTNWDGNPDHLNQNLDVQIDFEIYLNETIMYKAQLRLIVPATLIPLEANPYWTWNENDGWTIYRFQEFEKMYEDLIEDLSPKDGVQWQITQNTVTFEGRPDDTGWFADFPVGEYDGEEITWNQYMQIWGFLLLSLYLKVDNPNVPVADNFSKVTHLEEFPYFGQMFYITTYNSEQYVFNTIYGTWSKWTGLDMVDGIYAGQEFYFARAMPILGTAEDYLGDCRWCKLDYDSGSDTVMDGNNAPHPTQITSTFMTGYSDFGVPNYKQIMELLITATASTWWKSTSTFTNTLTFDISVDYGMTETQNLLLAKQPQALLDEYERLKKLGIKTFNFTPKISRIKSAGSKPRYIVRFDKEDLRKLKKLYASASLEPAQKFITLNSKPFRRFAYGITLKSDNYNIEFYDVQARMLIADK